MSNSQKYVIVSGFWAPDPTKEPEKHGTFMGNKDLNKAYKDRANFLDVWIRNTLQTSKPEHVYIFNSNSDIPDIDESFVEKVQIIDLVSNPGHSISTELKLCGWRASILAGAIIAYASRCDLIYKEQDCLCFGDWINEIYENSNGISCGYYKSDRGLKAEISLVFVRHDRILEFIETLLTIVNNDIVNPPYPETQMAELMDLMEGNYLSFGYGRDRPINYEDRSFYVQHIGYHEHESALQTEKEMRERGLL